jgi:hypothetical protein
MQNSQITAQRPSRVASRAGGGGTVVSPPIKKNVDPSRIEKGTQVQEKKERCPEVDLTYERQCELEAGHDGWHGFMWDWNDRSQGANCWPGPSLP